MPQILLENAYWFGPKWKALADEYEAIPAKNVQEKKDFRSKKLDPGISKYLNITNKNTKDILLKSIEKFGTNTKRNPVIIYIAGIKNGELPFLADKYGVHLNYLLKLLLDKKITFSALPKKLIYNIGLYNRSFDEFKWAIEAIPMYSGKKYQSEKDKNVVKAMTPPFYDAKGILRADSELKQIIQEWESRKVDVEDAEVAPANISHKITDKLISQYESLVKSDERLAFLKKHIFPMEIFQNLSGIKDILIEDFLISTINPKRNAFLDFVLKLPFPVTDTRKYREKFRYVYQSYKLNKLRLDLEVLTKQSLYERSEKDFRYTLNAFNLCSNPSDVSNYLKDVSKVNVKDFMNGDDTVKSAKDIYDIIEGWANNNEYSAQEIEDRNHKKENEPTIKELEKLKDKFKDSDLKTIEQALKDEGELKDGALVYSPKKDPNDKTNSNRGFYMWKDNKWEKYDTSDARKVVAAN